jgi:hypothetical protein
MHANRYVAGVMAVCLLLAPLSQAAKPMQQKPAPNSAQQGLDKLLAPIALYPDGLLAQVLACRNQPAAGHRVRWAHRPGAAPQPFVPSASQLPYQEIHRILSKISFPFPTVEVIFPFTCSAYSVAFSLASEG